MMAVCASLGAFLEANPEFEFDLTEYVLATRLMPAARARFEAFVRDMGSGRSMSWRANRDEIERVARHIPAYAQIEWSRDDYWKTIPLIDKDGLRARLLDFRNPDADESTLWRRDTSGTSGAPVTILYSPASFMEYQFFAIARLASLFGGFTADLCAQPVFCAVVADRRHLSKRVWVAPADITGWTLRIKFDEREADSLARFTAQLNRFRPAVLSLKPNTLDSIVRQMRGPRPLPYLRIIVSGGAELREDLRGEAERLLGVPVCNSYGMTEVGAIASECRHRSGLHLYESCLVAEVLGADGRLRREGAGELVLSSVANPAMPLLRYRSGDLVDLVSEPCPCGLPGRRIRSLSGRLIQNFRLADGSEYSPCNLDYLFRHFPIREFQATQLTGNRLRIEIEPSSECDDPSELLDGVRRYVKEELQVPMAVELSKAKFESNGKFQRYRPIPAGDLNPSRIGA